MPLWVFVWLDTESTITVRLWIEAILWWRLAWIWEMSWIVQPRQADFSQLGKANLHFEVEETAYLRWAQKTTSRAYQLWSFKTKELEGVGKRSIFPREVVGRRYVDMYAISIRHLSGQNILHSMLNIVFVQSYFICVWKRLCHPTYVHHFTPRSRHDLPSPAVRHG